MTRNQLRHLLAAAAAITAFTAAGTALAQYVWVDDKGVKQFSDMPPPASVPANRILKQPGGKSSAAPETNGSATAAITPKPELTTAEKNAEFRKRKTEQAEKEKKAEEEAKNSAEKSKNCDRARDYLRALESGERLTRTERNGDRAFLTDQQREQELKETRRTLQDCK